MLGLMLLFSWLGGLEQIIEASYTEFTAQLAQGEIKSVTFTDQDMIYTTLAGKKYHTLLPPLEDPNLMPQLLEKKVEVNTKNLLIGQVYYLTYFHWFLLYYFGGL